jgi:PIN domain nuclease of toxin-antitoxin system
LILLDTVAVFRIMERRSLLGPAREALRIAEVGGVPLAVSAITGWESCLLEKRGKTGLSIGGDGEAWFGEAIRVIGLTVISIDARIAIASRRLPAPFHEDPGDRFIVATARILDIPIITSDHDILTYAALGHVRAIAC